MQTNYTKLVEIYALRVSKNNKTHKKGKRKVLQYREEEEEEDEGACRPKHIYSSIQFFASRHGSWKTRFGLIPNPLAPSQRQVTNSVT